MAKYFSTKQTSELMNDSYKDNLNNDIKDIVSNKKTWNQGLDELLKKTYDIKERGYASETDKFALNTLKGALKNDKYLNSKRVANASEVSAKQEKLYNEIDNVLVKHDDNGNYSDPSNVTDIKEYNGISLSQKLDNTESEKLGVKEAAIPEKKSMGGWKKAVAAGLLAGAGIFGAYNISNSDYGAGRPAYALPTSETTEERVDIGSIKKKPVKKAEEKKKEETAPVKKEYKEEKAGEDYGKKQEAEKKAEVSESGLEKDLNKAKEMPKNIIPLKAEEESSLDEQDNNIVPSDGFANYRPTRDRRYGGDKRIKGDTFVTQTQDGPTVIEYLESHRNRLGKTVRDYVENKESAEEKTADLETLTEYKAKTMGNNFMSGRPIDIIFKSAEQTIDDYTSILDEQVSNGNLSEEKKKELVEVLDESYTNSKDDLLNGIKNDSMKDSKLMQAYGRTTAALDSVKKALMAGVGLEDYNKTMEELDEKKAKRRHKFFNIFMGTPFVVDESISEGYGAFDSKELTDYAKSMFGEAEDINKFAVDYDAVKSGIIDNSRRGRRENKRNAGKTVYTFETDNKGVVIPGSAEERLEHKFVENDDNRRLVTSLLDDAEELLKYDNGRAVELAQLTADLAEGYSTQSGRDIDTNSIREKIENKKDKLENIIEENRPKTDPLGAIGNFFKRLPLMFSAPVDGALNGDGAYALFGSTGHATKAANSLADGVAGGLFSPILNNVPALDQAYRKIIENTPGGKRYVAGLGIGHKMKSLFERGGIFGAISDLAVQAAPYVGYHFAKKGKDKGDGKQEEADQNNQSNGNRTETSDGVNSGGEGQPGTPGPSQTVDGQPSPDSAPTRDVTIPGE